MKIACVIPLYNNSATILSVAVGCRAIVSPVLVIDDGSTDLPEDFPATLASANIDFLRHDCNRGKGAALQTALQHLAQQQIDYMITIDADGQHRPEDLPAFLEVLQKDGQNRDLLVIGVRDFNAPNVPNSSKFGRNFSNFWVKLETGLDCADTQSGFRAYPVAALQRLQLRCTKYNFEIEVLVRALWGGVRLREVPISVIYEPPGIRISHFQPFMDNFRLSLLHTWLVTRRLLCLPHRRIVDTAPIRNIPSLWRQPRQYFLFLLRENSTPALLGISAGVGTFLAILPLIGCHSLAILYVTHRLRLNKVMALSIQNLYMPPFTPFLCIELGYLLRHGVFLRDFSMQVIFREAHQRLWEWLLGSLIIAPVAAALAGFIVYCLARRLTSARRVQHDDKI